MSSHIERRVRHWGTDPAGELIIAAVPALRGGDGIDIVIRIDGTYFEHSPEHLAALVAHHRETLAAELRADG